MEKHEQNQIFEYSQKIESYINRLIIFVVLVHVFYSVFRYVDSGFAILIRGIDYAAAGVTVFLMVVLILLNIKNVSYKNNIKLKIKSYFTKEQILLCIFIFLTIISIFVSIGGKDSEWIESNFRKLYDLLICALVLFPLGRYCAIHGIPKALKNGLIIILAVLALVLVAVLVRVMQGDMYVDVHDGAYGVFGINSRYQLCLNTHSNASGMYAAILVLICIACSIISKKLLRFFFVLCTIIFFVILVLSNSRGSYLGFSVALSILWALVVYKKASNVKKYIKWISAFVVAIISFLFVQLIRDGVYYVFDYITGYSQVINSDIGSGLEEVARDLNSTNLMGRDLIWNASIRAMFADFKHILIGVTPEGVVMALDEYLHWGVYTHNQFLEVGVAIGIPGMFTFIVFLIYIAKSCIFVGFADNRKVTLFKKIIPIIILELVINNLVEAILIWYAYLPGLVFLFLSGWISQYEKTHLEK